MPHQHHFLSRLDRISLPHVELALMLYRDPALVRWVLHEARLPEQAERAALSLADPVKGPFLVVTREGVFVTCLGEGMSVGNLPVIPRGQLDGLLSKGSDLRARAEVLAAVSGKLGGGTSIFRRLNEAADDVSREEMIAASALQPLYAFELFRLLTSAITDLEDARDILLPLLRRARKLNRGYDAALRAYWQTAWMVGHLTVLCGMSGPKLIEEMPEALRAQVLDVSLSWGAVRQGVVGLVLRGAWAAARVGKALLPAYKRRLPMAASVLTCLDALVPLCAMAIRHGRLRAEIEKALASAATVLQEATALAFPAAAVKAGSALLTLVAEQPDIVEQIHLGLGADIAVAMARHLPRGSPFAFERPEDVPRDLAFTLPASLPSSLLGQHVHFQPLIWMLPWVARASAEDLYLPRDYIQAMRAPWVPEHTYQLLRPLAEMYRPRAPQAEGPARKGPCPCGSGKKYKRCCGAEDERAATSPEGADDG